MFLSAVAERRGTWVTGEMKIAGVIIKGSCHEWHCLESEESAFIGVASGLTAVNETGWVCQN